MVEFLRRRQDVEAAGDEPHGKCGAEESLYPSPPLIRGKSPPDFGQTSCGENGEDRHRVGEVADELVQFIRPNSVGRHTEGDQNVYTDRDRKKRHPPTPTDVNR